MPTLTADLRILALETSGDAGSVALLAGDQVCASLPLDPTRRTVQTLAPTIAQALDGAGWQPREVQLVALTIGPGSFTGLRLAVATAKSFAYAVGAGVLGVDTLEVLAAGVLAASDAQYVEAFLDAQRGQVIAARYEREVGSPRPRCLRAAAIQDRTAWIAALAPGDVVAGPLLAKHAGELPSHATAAAHQLWFPSAVWTARLAALDHQAGRRLSPFELQPVYIRPSAAEEKRAQRDAGL